MEDESTGLGAFLKSARNAKGLTLRAVEDAIGVSNAYLSQLESGKIQKPSPAVLHKLSGLYGVSYAVVMEYAGHPVPGNITSSGRSGFASQLGPTTKEEEEALLEYLQFLRSRRDRTGGARP